MTTPVRAAFSSEVDGDLREDVLARSRFSSSQGIPDEWATVRQVHGSTVVHVAAPGPAGEADALVTTVPGVPLAVFTADCLGVVVVADGAVGVAHAGWRGVVAGVVPATLAALRGAGSTPRSAFIGPSIGPCCFEVGPEVAERLPGHLATTTWGTVSVDLRSAVREQLGVPTEIVGGCTRCGTGSFSYRRDGTAHRMAAVGWIP